MKIGLVCANLNERWESCQKIANNLIRSYKLKFKDIGIFSVKSSSSIEEYISTQEIAKNIIKEKIDTLVFVDYRPHPLLLIKKLDELKFYPKLIFHVYGDYVLFVKEWIELEGVLEKFKVKFIAASDAQAGVVKKTLLKNNCSKIPFPVDCDLYTRKEIKKSSFNILKEEDVVNLVYTGRITHQKNNVLLLKTIEMVKRLTGKNLKLYIAGKFDDLGYPYFGKMFRKHSYKRVWDKTIDILNLKNDSIVYLGNLNEEELIELYNEADIYISLSTHNDEDYGMSPAEAFCCGMDGILTYWGGFSSFNIDSNIEYVDVKFSDTINHKIETKKIIKIIQNYKKKDLEEKKRISQVFKNHFSINSISEEIHNTVKSDFENFEGFTDLFKKIKQLFEYDKTAPFLDVISNEKVSIINGESSFERDIVNKLNDTYEELYIEYIRRD